MKTIRLAWFDVLVFLIIYLAFHISGRKHILGIWKETAEVTSVRRPHWCSFHLSHVQVSNKGMWMSVAEVRRVSRTWSSAVFLHGGSRQKVQISAGVRWGRESLPHHRQHCQPCVKRNLAGRQPNNPTRGHIFCYGSRSAAFCKPEFGSMATKCLEVVVCKIAQCCRCNSFCRCWGLRKYIHYSCQRNMKSGFQIGTCMIYFFGLPFLNSE